MTHSSHQPNPPNPPSSLNRPSKSQLRFNEQVISTLKDIKTQNNDVLAKIDKLETTLTKKATMAGAMAGAVSGGITGTVVSVGLELLKAKLGG